MNASKSEKTERWKGTKAIITHKSNQMSDIKMKQRSITFAQTGSCFDATNTAGIKVSCEITEQVKIMQFYSNESIIYSK